MNSLDQCNIGASWQHFYKPSIWAITGISLSQDLDSIFLILITLNYFPLHIHFTSPEKCIVQESCLMFGPVIFELRNLKVEASKRVRTKKKSSTFSCSQTKVFLEEICSHLPIAMRIWMTFFNCGLIRLQTWF